MNHLKNLRYDNQKMNINLGSKGIKILSFGVLNELMFPKESSTIEPLNPGVPAKKSIKIKISLKNIKMSKLSRVELCSTK